LNVQNGTVDLRTGKLRPHNPADMLTKLAPVTYDMDADCPTWLAFMDRIMASNAELIEYLQRLVGYCLTGDVSEHILPVLWGDGANGKSTLVNCVLHLLGGEYSMPAPEHLLMLRKGEQHPTETACLCGRRFIGAIETEGNRRLAESRVKMLTGGDRLTARRMREDFWDFDPTHKIWLASNHKPIIRGDDLGIWRRVKLIPFVVKIPEEEQDKQLPDKLRAEMPGILMWALSGCLQWQHDGMKEPAIVRGATDKYRQDMDMVAQFVAECCVVGPRFQTLAKQVHEAYAEWGGTMGSRSFYAKLRDKGFTVQTGTAGEFKKMTTVYGLGLTSIGGEGGDTVS
jgi:putative DNA primase/helicase